MTDLFVYTEDPSRRVSFVDALAGCGFGVAESLDAAGGAVFVANGLVAVLAGDAPEEPMADAVATAVAHLPALDGPPWLSASSVERLFGSVRQSGTPPLSAREQMVLALMADGYSTADVARQLAYSERMIKIVLHGVTTRLGLRNRCHAVAVAVREGLI